MSKKIGWIAAILSVIAIILGIASLAAAKKPAEKVEPEDKDVQYVLYLGTNDKDTNEPVFAIVYTEYTLVIYLSDTTLKDVHAAADEMVKTFHQSSVLIQANETTTEFYGGE